MLTLLILLVTSCSSPTRQIDALNCNDYYLYSIGIGQRVFVGDDSIELNEELCDFIKDFKETGFSCEIKDINEDSSSEFDEDIISVEFYYMFKLSITCLKEFEGTIKIESITYLINNTDVKVGYNINLIYNKTYQSQPNAPISFLSCYDLGTTNPYCDLILIPSNKKFYILFENLDLIKVKTDQYVVRNVSSNNNYLKIDSVKYSRVPKNFIYLLDFLDLEYVEFTDQINLNDFECGIVFEITFDFENETFDTIGCDLNFDVVYNGVEFIFPLNVFYSNNH